MSRRVGEIGERRRDKDVDLGVRGTKSGVQAQVRDYSTVLMHCSRWFRWLGCAALAISVACSDSTEADTDTETDDSGTYEGGDSSGGAEDSGIGMSGDFPTLIAPERNPPRPGAEAPGRRGGVRRADSNETPPPYAGG